MTFDIAWFQNALAHTVFTFLALPLLVWISRRISSFWKPVPKALERLRRRYMRWFLKHAQAIDRDPMLLQLEINRSGVYLTLFLVCFLVWIVASAALFAAVPVMRDWPNLTIGISALPMYAFEFAWLLKSTKVDNVFKRRRRRAQRGVSLQS